MPKQRHGLIGVLAAIAGGLGTAGTLARIKGFSTGASSRNRNAPGHVQDWLKQRAAAKRRRRAANPGATAYARANVRA